MRKSLIGAVLGVVAVAVIGIGVAGADTKGPVTFETKYSNPRPNSSSGFNTAISGAPKDSQGKLDAANRVVVKFHPGAKFDTNVPGKCDQTKLPNCPKNSIVGKGSAEAISGITAIDPVKETITAYNKKNGLIFYLQGIQTLSIVAKLKGETLDAKVPLFPVPGNPKGAVLTKFNLKINAVSKTASAAAKKKNYVTTPPVCKGKWTVKASFYYPNVPAIKDVPSTTKCKK